MAENDATAAMSMNGASPTEKKPETMRALVGCIVKVVPIGMPTPDAMERSIGAGIQNGKAEIASMMNAPVEALEHEIASITPLTLTTPAIGPLTSGQSQSFLILDLRLFAHVVKQKMEPVAPIEEAAA